MELTDLSNNGGRNADDNDEGSNAEQPLQGVASDQRTTAENERSNRCSRAVDCVLACICKHKKECSFVIGCIIVLIVLIPFLCHSYGICFPL